MLRENPPPRALAALAAAVAFVPVLLLVWVGWRLLDQDRALEQQQVQQRVERAADLAVAALRQKLSAIEQQLDVADTLWSDRLLVVELGSESVRLRAGRVAYLPVAPSLPEPSEAIFAEGERREFVEQAPAAAVMVFAQLAKSKDPAIAAGGHVRLGRALTKAGRLADASAAYAELAHRDDVAVGGVPASLAGSYALGRVLQVQGRETELRELGVKLRRDLLDGRWPITEPVYRLYMADANRWARVSPSTEDSERLAEALAILWLRWTAVPSTLLGDVSREAIVVDGRRMTVLGRRVDDVYRTIIATPEAVEADWLTALEPIASAHHVRVGLGGGDAGPIVARRTAADSGLPWTVTASALEPPPERAEFAFRRHLLIAGFGVLLGMAALAGYFIMRAVSRELTVARMQSELVAAVSHEFRTPLTTLRQFTDMLREQPSLSAERRILAYEAQSRATERLTHLVESMLDFGRMEAGAHRYRFESRDCAALVRRVVDDYSSVACSAGRTVAFAGDAHSAVTTDEDALSTAVRNLLDNAVKYSPGSEVVSVAVQRRNGDVRISVTDRGIGIPSSERQQIFARFHRGEQARVRGIKGTGIGLAMVHEIVKAHKGRVEVDSVPGTGSTFTIVLPAED